MDEFQQMLADALGSASPVARAALEAAFVEPEREPSISGVRNREGLPPMLPVGPLPGVM